MATHGGDIVRAPRAELRVLVRGACVRSRSRPRTSARSAQSRRIRQHGRPQPRVERVDALLFGDAAERRRANRRGEGVRQQVDGAIDERHDRLQQRHLLGRRVDERGGGHQVLHDLGVIGRPSSGSSAGAGVGGGDSDKSKRAVARRRAQPGDDFVEHADDLAHFRGAIAVVRARPVGQRTARLLGGDQPLRADRESARPG